jgi:hypothetical protein
MSGLDLLSLAFGGLGLLMFVLSPLAKQTSGYRKPLDQFGPASVFERDVSRHESAYNRNPRLAMIKGGIASLVTALLLQSFKLF